MLAALLPSKSLANFIDTWLYDDGVDLHVSGLTELTSSDVGPYCEPYFGSGYVCYGTNYPAVRVDTRLLAPGSWPVQNSQSIDASYAEASFSYYPPAAGGQWWGWWWAESDHYVQVEMYQHFCVEPGFACHCPSGFPYPCGSIIQWQYLGQTSTSVIVDPPPPPDPCDELEVAHMVFEYFAYQVNFTAICSDFANFGGTAHFSWAELNGRGPGSTSPYGNLHWENGQWGMVQQSLTTNLETTRVHYGKPVVITGGYRCPHGNYAVGGSSTSWHMHGRAVDMRSEAQLWTMAECEDLRQIIVDETTTVELLFCYSYGDPGHLHAAW